MPRRPTPPPPIPVEESPVEEAPLAETPVVEVPANEVPVVESPMVEAPVIEAPAEESRPSEPAVSSVPKNLIPPADSDPVAPAPPTQPRALPPADLPVPLPPASEEVAAPSPFAPPPLPSATAPHSTSTSTKKPSDPRSYCEFVADSLYPSAFACAKCHEKIFDEWSVSSHAYAAISPMFHKFEQKINDLSQGTIGYFCYRCHSPVGTSLGISRAAPMWDVPPGCPRGGDLRGLPSGQSTLRQGQR